MAFVARLGTRPRTIDPDSSLAARQARMVMLGSLEPRDLHTRRYLHADEVEKLMIAVRGMRYGARHGVRHDVRHGLRDATLLLLAYRHDLPLGELLALRWEQINFKHRTLRTGGLHGDGGVAHALAGRELRGLRMMARDYAWYPHVFNADGGAPLTGRDVVRLLARAGEIARLGFTVHPHMLRHACGIKRDPDARHAWSVQQYLGHRNVRRGVRFAESAPRHVGEFGKS